jgi:prophage regulatory protein
MNTNSFIRQKQLLLKLPFSAPTLWRKVKAGTFPKPVKLGENITAWRIEDIDAWVKEINND